jgi:uncharacterized membrane protein
MLVPSVTDRYIKSFGLLVVKLTVIELPVVDDEAEPSNARFRLKFAVIVPAAFIVAVVEADVALVIVIPVVALHDEK